MYLFRITVIMSDGSCGRFQWRYDSACDAICTTLDHFSEALVVAVRRLSA